MNHFSLYTLFLGLGMKEILVIGLVCLLFFGGKKIPELMRGLGSGIKEFKKSVKDEDDECPIFYLWLKWMKNTDKIETLDLLVDLKYWSNNHRAMECCFEYCGEDEVFDLLKKVDEVYYDDRFS